MLPHGEQYPCDVGKRQENLPKNRFKTTFPCTFKFTFDIKKSFWINLKFHDNENDGVFVVALMYEYLWRRQDIKKKKN